MIFVRKHIFIFGKVQRVFFRQETRLRANYLKVRGFVRNLEDKRVEAVLEGEEEKVEKLIKWMSRGPALAKVDKLKIIDEKYKGEFNKFDIKY